MKGNTYVLDKDGTFITVSASNKIGTTTDLSEASRFTWQEAERLKNKATKKTKGFVIRKVISAGPGGTADGEPGAGSAAQGKTKRKYIPESLKIKVYNQ